MAVMVMLVKGKSSTPIAKLVYTLPEIILFIRHEQLINTQYSGLI
jgi:hypothetical protein